MMPPPHPDPGEGRKESSLLSDFARVFLFIFFVSLHLWLSVRKISAIIFVPHDNETFEIENMCIDNKVTFD